MNENDIKIKVIKSIIEGYYDYPDSEKEYTEAIINCIFEVINTNIIEGDKDNDNV